MFTEKRKEMKKISMSKRLGLISIVLVVRMVVCISVTTHVDLLE